MQIYGRSRACSGAGAIAVFQAVVKVGLPVSTQNFVAVDNPADAGICRDLIGVKSTTDEHPSAQPLER
ncbi:MAG: hypothetical protein U0Y68_00495 [Blastocatellia bacterium]